MTKTQIKNSLEDLNTLVMSGKLLDAFEKYYHQDVELQENSNDSFKGKDINRQREIDFVNSITEFRNASVEDTAIGKDISFVVWSYDYTHKEWGVRKYTQVSVQHWRDGLIIKEQFFYGN